MTAALAWIGLAIATTVVTSPTHPHREPGMSDRAAAVYAETAQLMRDAEVPGNAQRMFDLLVPVVREQRHPLLIGRLVVASAAIASSGGGERRVDVLIAHARRPQADDVDRFVAGVAAHYRGHLRGATQDAKKADYRRTIEFLEPLRVAFADAPRLWIYLAVSYARTGRHAEAADAIEKAVAADSGGDADVYYCRAEVWHRRDPARAVADIDRYIAIMARNKTHGAWSATGKEQRVREMRAELAAVASGTAQASAVELFDPVRMPPPDDGPDWLWDFGIVLLLLVTVLGVWRWTRRRRRSP